MLQLAMKSAHDKGVVLIAAAGNLGPKAIPRNKRFMLGRRGSAAR
jgi:hypothetical protein